MKTKELKEQVEMTKLAIKGLQDHIRQLEKKLNEPSVEIGFILNQVKKIDDLERKIEIERNLYYKLVKDLSPLSYDELNYYLKQRTSNQ